MNKHYSVINKKGLIIISIFMGINAAVAGVSLSMMLSNGSKLWLIPVIIFVTFFLFTFIIMNKIISAGIDVKRGDVIMPDMDVQKGTCFQFSMKDLESIHLENGDEEILNPDKDSLAGARITFVLKDGSKKQYYPLTITKKQYKSIEKGMMSSVNELNNDDLFFN